MSNDEPLPAPKPLRADARRNRALLIAKAREVLAAGHFELRFDDFARLAGVGTGTLYRHFPTREALIEAVYHEEVATLCARAATLQASLPPAEALGAFLRDFIAYLDTHLGLARSLVTVMVPHNQAMAEGSLALGEAMAALLTAAAASGAVRADIGPAAVMMTLHGICAAYDQPDWRSHADDVVTLVLDGLQRREQPRDADGTL